MPIYKFSEITEKIIGAAMHVHAALGNGFQGVIYQRALAIELDDMAFITNANRKCRFITKAGTSVQGELTFSWKRK